MIRGYLGISKSTIIPEQEGSQEKGGISVGVFFNLADLWFMEKQQNKE